MIKQELKYVNKIKFVFLNLAISNIYHIYILDVFSFSNAYICTF